ncbi:hypothetical protein [Parabacteroides sp. PF5-9]|uniref:hypothetical protein n=1 Tax=Parabacteroides sp. PF5-9 TaxID=1742404 RepID=UPI002474184B|nr:hypothetical protein [Parabacteroides sp. PF5-9]MDH6356259.1 hypothetical protein [Parabacteroides sp. PF5-9]
MTNTEIVEQTQEYTIYATQFRGIPQRFRQWHTQDLIEIEFSDNFAFANGYINRADMLRKEPGVRKSCALAGGVPDWIAIIDKDFYVKIGCMN